MCIRDSHYCGVISPTGGGFPHLTIPPEETMPFSVSITPCQTDRFGTGSGNSQTDSEIRVFQLVERARRGVVGLKEKSHDEPKEYASVWNW